jgi:hypothetical protein
MINIIRNIWNNTKCCVKISSCMSMSECFDVTWVWNRENNCLLCSFYFLSMRLQEKSDILMTWRLHVVLTASSRRSWRCFGAFRERYNAFLRRFNWRMFTMHADGRRSMRCLCHACNITALTSTSWILFGRRENAALVCQGLTIFPMIFIENMF